MASSQFIQRAYIAFFNRPADKDGYKHWLNYRGSDYDLLNEFAQSAEYLSDYDGKGNREVIETIYQNLFGREPEVDGWNYWEAQMNAGWVTVGNAAYAILSGAQGTDLDAINKKTAAAEAFTNALETAFEIAAYAKANANGVGNVAKDWLATVTYSSESYTTAIDNLDNVVDTLLGAHLPPLPPPPSRETSSYLSDSALKFLFPAACQYWIDVGVSAEKFDGIKFSVSSRVGIYGRDTLAVTIGSQILFSPYAGAGSWSWFVDCTPFKHEEFNPGSAYAGFTALPKSAAYGNMDLLTVFIHEIGHVIGLGHEDLLGDCDVMAPYLEAGVRRLPTSENLSAANYFSLDYMIEFDAGNGGFSDTCCADAQCSTEALDIVQVIGYADYGIEAYGAGNIGLNLDAFNG